MEALKCLAEIGPLKMQNNFYYFQTDFDAFVQVIKSKIIINFKTL